MLVSIRPAAAGDSINVAVANVRDSSFTVAWLTARAETGQVELIGGATYQDVRGANYSGVTHYVNVTGVSANSTPVFDVQSGSRRYDNGGAHWMVATGATLQTLPADWIGGIVRQTDGANASDVIVFVTLQRLQFTENAVSARMATLITHRDDGFFRVNLSEARLSSNPSGYFVYARGSDHLMNNAVTIQAVGAGGSALFTADTGDSRLREMVPEEMIALTLTPDAQEAVPAPETTTTAKTSPREEDPIPVGVAITIGGLVVIALAWLAWQRSESRS